MGLLRLLAEHEGPLTADFQREYGLRLRDAVLERTVDEIEDLILWLPVQSVFRAKIKTKTQEQAEREWAWSDENELLLSLINLLITQTHVIAQSNSTKKIKAPDMVESPRSKNGPKPAQTRPDADSQARAMIAAIRARKGM